MVRQFTQNSKILTTTRKRLHDTSLYFPCYRSGSMKSLSCKLAGTDRYAIPFSVAGHATVLRESCIGNEVNCRETDFW